MDRNKNENLSNWEVKLLVSEKWSGLQQWQAMIQGANKFPTRLLVCTFFARRNSFGADVLFMVAKNPDRLEGSSLLE